MKVLLINPPSSKSLNTDRYIPIGLLSLATVLKENGDYVRILDLHNLLLGRNEVVLQEHINRLLPYIMGSVKPDIVGIGCPFSGAFNNLRVIARHIKEVYSIPIVIGGIHPTAFKQEILDKYDYIDYVISGEGENALLSLVTGRNLGGFVEDLDSLPYPDYSLLNLDEYRFDTSQWYSPKGIDVGLPFPIISSRSCPQKCTFCSMWLVHGTKWRARSASNVIWEMMRLYNQYGARYFQFMDDNFTYDKERVLDICHGIQGLNIQFDTPNGVALNRLDEEMIDAMVGVGWVSTGIGIESGSEYIRNKVMKKGLTGKKLYGVVGLLKKHKQLFLKGFFIIGMPEETYETLSETYDMIKELALDKVGVYYAVPYPGTELYNQCVRDGLIEADMDAEVFMDSDPYPHFKPYNLTCEDLVKFKESVCL